MHPETLCIVKLVGRMKLKKLKENIQQRDDSMFSCFSKFKVERYG